MTLFLRLQVQCHPKRYFCFVWGSEWSVCALTFLYYQSKGEANGDTKRDGDYRNEGRSFHGYQRDDFNDLLRCNELQLRRCDRHA